MYILVIHGTHTTVETTALACSHSHAPLNFLVLPSQSIDSELPRKKENLHILITQESLIVLDISDMPIVDH